MCGASPQHGTEQRDRNGDAERFGSALPSPEARDYADGRLQ
jgi:hypothetical protein